MSVAPKIHEMLFRENIGDHFTKRGADQGDAEVQHIIGIDLREGFCVGVNRIVESARYLGCLADQGFAISNGF